MKEREIERLNKLKEFEKKLYKDGIKYIAGIDEAGRGPLAGPVVIGCVIMKPDSFIEYVNDSKKISETKREMLYEKITSEALAWSTGIVWQEEIDEINILNATKKALTLAIEGLKIKPDTILVDALDKIDTKGIPYISVIKGDAKIYSISAASIIAKVTRDRIMKEYDEVYPEYGFLGHKGYGTAKHIQAIKEYGICPLHRRTFTKRFV
ncbi:MAG: ribonuclease HII [Clostridia bacterium]|nr:ribonuclease HII [Clostridia bacterium]